MGNSYKGSYNKSDNHKKHKLSQNAKSMLSLAALGVSALGISTADYLHELKQQVKEDTNEAIYMDIKPIEHIQEELIKENAEQYNASDIINDYYYNETTKQRQRLDEKYIDKYLEVTGEVNQTHSSLVEGYYISLINDDPINTVTSWGKIICNIEDKEDKELMRQLNTGDDVTVVGYGQKGFAMLDLEDCDIIKISGKEITR